MRDRQGPTNGRRRALLAAGCTLALAAPGCEGESPPATERGARPDAPADESTPRRKADTPTKLIRCLERQRVKAERPSAETSGDTALDAAGIAHETVTVGGNTDVVAYFLEDRGQLREAKEALGLNAAVASSGPVLVAYLKDENRMARGPAIEACL
jgi:hypothetical protein